MKNRFFIIWFLFSSWFLLAQNEMALYNIDKNNVAVEGYDLVSYFKDHKATKGNPLYSVVEKGITYYFTNEEHKTAFLKKPVLYKPQYGGWCAYAIGKTGEKVEVDPKTFKIIDDKLYLFYNKYLTNTLKLWNKEENMLLTNADKNWKTIINK